jgi:hypothetical protein
VIAAFTASLTEGTVSVEVCVKVRTSAEAPPAGAKKIVVVVADA